MDKYILVFDAGTGAGRCVLFDLKGKMVGSEYEEWDYEKVEGREDCFEFNADKFWNILAGLARKVLFRAKVNSEKIIAVSAASQREGMVLLDKEGKEVYAAPSIDMRGEEMLEMLQEEREFIQSRTGLPLHGMFGLARLLWLKKHCRETYDKIDKLLMISDWIAYKLSGVAASENSVASSSQLFDIKNQQWSMDVVKKVGLRGDIFPDIVQAGMVIGRISQRAAEETGLAAGTRVVAGGADTQMGLLGMGVTAANEIGIVAGTTTPVMMVTLEYLELNKRREVFHNCHAVTGRKLLESNGGITGLALRWVRDVFLKETADGSFDQMMREAGEIPVGAGGMRCYIGAEIAGKKQRNVLSGFFFPLPWMLDDYNRGHFFRAAVEANVFSVRANLDQLLAITSAQPGYISLCGGQSSSDLFNQMLADVTGMPVQLYESKETTSLGAAICAAVGASGYNGFDDAIKHMVREKKLVNVNREVHEKYQTYYFNWLKNFVEGSEE